MDNGYLTLAIAVLTGPLIFPLDNSPQFSYTEQLEEHYKFQPCSV
jgi:hypothetical protein